MNEAGVRDPNKPDDWLDDMGGGALRAHLFSQIEQKGAASDLHRAAYEQSGSVIVSCLSWLISKIEIPRLRGSRTPEASPHSSGA